MSACAAERSAQVARVEHCIDRLLELGLTAEAVEPVREWVRAQRGVTASQTSASVDDVPDASLSAPTAHSAVET